MTGYTPHINDIGVDAYGNIAMAKNDKAVRDIVDALVKTHKGELQLAIDRGIPYDSTVFVHKKFLPIWEAEVRDAVKSCEGVTGIESFEYTLEGDELHYTIVITTEYGTETVTNG